MDINSLFNKTGISAYDTSIKGFGDRPKTRTPSIVLDSFLGGGIPLGCVVEVAGASKGGKTTFCYQTLGMFLQDHPDGIAVILESESSHDRTRMEHTFGIDVNRVFVYPGVTLNKGFEAMITLAENMAAIKPKERVPIFVLWDSISNSATDAQVDSQSVNGGGMAEAARLIRQYFKILMTKLADVDLCIMLISQVSQKIGSYVPGFTTSGGEGLKHDVHLKLWIDGGKLATNEQGFYSTNTSKLKIEKSKISPLIDNINLVLDISKGGAIDMEDSLVHFFYEKSIFQMVSNGWYSINPELVGKYPQYADYIVNHTKMMNKQRWNAIIEEIRNNKVLLDIMTLAWVDMVGENYGLQKIVCESYREGLVSRLKEYENPVNIPEPTNVEVDPDEEEGMDDAESDE